MLPLVSLCVSPLFHTYPSPLFFTVPHHTSYLPFVLFILFHMILPHKLPCLSCTLPHLTLPCPLPPPLPLPLPSPHHLGSIFKGCSGGSEGLRCDSVTSLGSHDPSCPSAQGSRGSRHLLDDSELDPPPPPPHPHDCTSPPSHTLTRTWWVYNTDLGNNTAVIP